MLVLKDVLRPRLKPSSSGGGRVPTRQVPYRQKHIYIQVFHFQIYLGMYIVGNDIIFMLVIC